MSPLRNPLKEKRTLTRGSQECLPNTNGTIVATYDAPPYIGQHSHDYSFFYTANQAFQLHLYSTQLAPRKRPPAERQAQQPMRRRIRNLMMGDDDDEAVNESSLHKIKTVQGVYGQWTVTDADLSRDNEWYVRRLRALAGGDADTPRAGWYTPRSRRMCTCSRRRNTSTSIQCWISRRRLAVRPQDDVGCGVAVGISG